MTQVREVPDEAFDIYGKQMNLGCFNPNRVQLPKLEVGGFRQEATEPSFHIIFFWVTMKWP